MHIHTYTNTHTNIEWVGGNNTCTDTMSANETAIIMHIKTLMFFIVNYVKEIDVWIGLSNKGE